MNAQIIEKDGKPEWAVIPYSVYRRLTEDAEMLQDIRDYDEAKKAIEGGEELIPSEVTYAILDGESPIRVWREYRGLTQQQLADAAGISTPYLSQIESGKRKGSADVLAAIAKALDLPLDDIVVAE
jgi:DNA-binding XRE family transcriptional regulator